MTTDRRKLNPQELAECAALKAEIAAHNARALPGQRLTQEVLAQELGMTQGNLSSHLNGKRAISKEMAAKAALLLGIQVEAFSPRLSAEIAQMAQAVQPPNNAAETAEAAGRYQGTSKALPQVAVLIGTALAEGRLTASDGEELRRMALHLISKNLNANTGYVTVPTRLDGLADAALRTAENGENPDDLLKMLEKGMSKQQPTEEPKPHEVREKRTR